MDSCGLNFLVTSCENQQLFVCLFFLFSFFFLWHRSGFDFRHPHFFVCILFVCLFAFVLFRFCFRNCTRCVFNCAIMLGRGSSGKVNFPIPSKRLFSQKTSWFRPRVNNLSSDHTYFSHKLWVLLMRNIIQKYKERTVCYNTS